MRLKRWANSLVTRMIAIGIVLVVLGTLARYHLLANTFRDHLMPVVAAQQVALAESVASDIEHRVRSRLDLLVRLSAQLPRPLLDHPAALSNWLAERHSLLPDFADGLLITDAQGRVLAQRGVVVDARLETLAGQPFFEAFRTGSRSLGAPVDGLGLLPTALPMGLPLRNDAGEVLAVLIGLTALNAPDFLDRVSQGRIGQSGDFLLVSPQDQRFIAAGKPALALAPTPPAGINALHDRAMAGYRGSGMTVNALGVEEISAMASVPSAGWFVVARIPTAEAFEPVRKARQTIVMYGLVNIVIIITVISVMFGYLLRPLFRSAELAEGMTQGTLPLARIPVRRDDEIGHLTAAFNRLLDKLMATQDELQRRAHHDPLTQLPNRLLLADRMHVAQARARREGAGLALLFLDLDGFKPINDRLGHEVGDLALIEVARRLSAIVRESDTLARVGGDEFVLLISDRADHIEAAARAVADKCIELVAQPLQIAGEDCSLGVSIGIALGDGDSDPERWMIAADLTMYEAKAQGRGCYVLRPAAAAAAAIKRA